MLPSPHYIPLAASLNISYDIRRKVLEAAAEVRSDTQLDHVLFHQCKRVADWLRFESSYMRLADWLRVELIFPIQKNRDSCSIMNVFHCCLRHRSGSNETHALLGVLCVCVCVLFVCLFVCFFYFASNIDDVIELTWPMN